MSLRDYMSTPAWRELTTETIRGHPTLVWRERPRHVLDLLDLAAAADERDFIVQGERRISFGAVRRAIDNGAHALAELGAKRGDCVLIVLYNAPEFLLAQWSCWRLGAVPILGNRWWSESELMEVLERVQPALLITDMELSTANARRWSRVTPATLSSWWSLPPAVQSVADPRASTDEDDVALVVFTAGSTGVPKGVQLTHRNLVWTQQTLHVMRGGRPPAPTTAAEQKVALMTTPMFHNGAVVAGLAALLDGNRMVLLQGKFRPEEVLALIQRERVTSWNAVPTMFHRVLRHPSVADFDLSSLVAPSTGGTIVPAQLLRDVQARLPQAADTFSIGYGMTEMSFLTMASAAQVKERLGTVGKPIPGVDLRIEQPDANGEGELIARSGALMAGYFKAEEQPIDGRGWYHTGDVGRIDADGFVYVTGRLKDMVIRGGENISCPQVEAALVTHPAVLEVAVIGYPDDEFGEALAAIVHLRAGSTANEDELRAFARQHLAYFAVPTKWIFRHEPLPVLATGKIDKRSLRRALGA